MQCWWFLKELYASLLSFISLTAFMRNARDLISRPKKKSLTFEWMLAQIIAWHTWVRCPDDDIFFVKMFLVLFYIAINYRKHKEKEILNTWNELKMKLLCLCCGLNLTRSNEMAWAINTNFPLRFNCVFLFLPQNFQMAND